MLLRNSTRAQPIGLVKSLSFNVGARYAFHYQRVSTKSVAVTAFEAYQTFYGDLLQGYQQGYYSCDTSTLHNPDCFGVSLPVLIFYECDAA